MLLFTAVNVRLAVPSTGDTEVLAAFPFTSTPVTLFPSPVSTSESFGRTLPVALKPVIAVVVVAVVVDSLAML